MSPNFMALIFPSVMNRLSVYSYLIRYVMGMPGLAFQRIFPRKELLKKEWPSDWAHNNPLPPNNMNGCTIFLEIAHVASRP